jgi:hypothetical protein
MNKYGFDEGAWEAAKKEVRAKLVELARRRGRIPYSELVKLSWTVGLWRCECLLLVVLPLLWIVLGGQLRGSCDACSLTPMRGVKRGELGGLGHRFSWVEVGVDLECVLFLINAVASRPTGSYSYPCVSRRGDSSI